MVLRRGRGAGNRGDARFAFSWVTAAMLRRTVALVGDMYDGGVDLVVSCSVLGLP